MLHVRALALLAAIAVLAGCGSSYEPLELRYRLAIDYETGGTQKATSGVIEVSYLPSSVPNHIGIQDIWRGETVRGEAADGRYFFPLNSRAPGGAPLANIVSDACEVSPPDTNDLDDAAGFLRQVDSAFLDECSLPPERWPVIAITDDPDNPHAVKLHNPRELPGDLRILRVAISRTTDPVTFGATSILTWLDQSVLRAEKLSVTNQGASAYYRISAGLFLQPSPIPDL